jgi:hypothetical protein
LDNSAIAGEIDLLLERGLLRQVPGSNENTVEATSPWREAFRAQLPYPDSMDAALLEQIDDVLKSFADFSPRERALIERLGWATWERPRRAWREAIREATQLIRLGVYSSITVYDEIQDVIRRAMVEHQSMRVQILMFSPELAAHIERNPDLANDVRKRTRDWQRLFVEALEDAKTRGNHPVLEIRHLSDRALSNFHRVALIDDRTWILNIHRPGEERGTQGIVYRGERKDGGTQSNLHAILDHYWHSAWERASDVRPERRLIRSIQTHLHLALLVVLPFFALYIEKQKQDWLGIKNDWWGGAVIGLMVGELYNARRVLLRILSGILNGANFVLRQLTR